jgi:hypothetical protein
VHRAIDIPFMLSVAASAFSGGIMVDVAGQNARE